MAESKTIYLVCAPLDPGGYDGSINLRAYTDKAEAEKFVTEYNNKESRPSGLEYFIEELQLY